MNQCPFLSTIEEKVQCFKECPFFEFECGDEGCPFRKAKAHKAFNIKEILSFDIEEDMDEVDSDFGFSEEYV